jgi:hypothetical protein
MTHLSKVLAKVQRVDLSNEFTDEAYKRLHKRQVLKFNQDGEIHAYRIVRLNRPRRICEAIPVDLYTEEEAKQIVEGNK